MRQQTVRYATAGVIATVLVIGLTIMVNWISVRRWHRFDMTSAKIYSLSEKSKSILAGLKDEISVVVFMTEASSMYRQVSELLSRYEAASGKITVEFIDPDREPLRTQQLAEKFKIALADTVVFTYGDRTKYVTSDQLAEIDYSGAQYGQGPKLKAFKGEEQFTSAILSLVAQYVPKLYLVTGHGEATTEPRSQGQQSIAVLEELLKRENMEVESTRLLTGEVPDDADILAIIGPTHAYTDDELSLLGSYLDGGGRLLVCLDPVINEDGSVVSTRLEELLDSYGVHVNADLVIDPNAGLQGFDLSTLYLADYQTHTITAGLQGVSTLFLVARSLEPVDGLGWQAEPLVETSPEGWGETDIAGLLQGEMPVVDDTDSGGPVAVAVAVEGKDAPVSGDEIKVAGEDEVAVAGEDPDQLSDSPRKGFRLVVLGDADFISDNIISNLGNMTLALNAVNWLAEREEVVGIPPHEIDQPSMYLSMSSLGWILLITVVLMPGAAVMLGIIVWRRRRH
jgi:ABC-type uncharacterized transport system involved in gliding motility auxiliary subunit